jgi:putative transposase
MARLARVIAVGVPHHITQRGNARRFILQDEPDRKVISIYYGKARKCMG